MSENENARFGARMKGQLTHIINTLFGHGQWKSWLLLPLCLLICLGLYYGAKGISTLRLQSAQKAAEHMKAEVREGEGTYYFNMLSGREQYVYDAMREALDVYSSQTKLLSFVPTEKEFQNAVAAVLCDHPDYAGVISAKTEMETSKYSARISFVYAEDARARREALPALAASLLAEFPTYITREYDRAVWIHDALVKTAVYLDENGAQNTQSTDAYDALSGIPCDGYAYASAYAYLCREAGLSAEVVLGTANGASHAWNLLLLNEGIGYVDAMWNDTPTKATDLSFHGYFMLTKENISLDHSFIDQNALEGDSADYYTYYGYAITDGEDTESQLISLLTVAAEDNVPSIELLLPPSLTDDTAFKELLRTALIAVAENDTAPKIRTVNRIYHASDSLPARTVQLFYEE